MITRNLILAAGACLALGLAGVGFINPPTDPHKTQPAPKTTPVKVVPPSREKEKAPARSDPKPVPRDDDHETQDTPADKPGHDARPVDPVPASPPAAHGAADVPDADQALQLLREGNERWFNDQATAPNTGSARREDASQNGQRPFATILTCADSRVPVERVFDRGVGDLFVVRVAGNVVSGEVAGTIEYGAEHLNVPLLVVMGHTKCGAVAAAAAGGAPEGNIGLLIEKITPAVQRAKRQLPGVEPAQLAAAGVRENVWQSIFDLIRSSTEVRHLVDAGKLTIVGAVCDISSGKVEWMGPHPWQDALVDAFEARRQPHEKETAGAGEH